METIEDLLADHAFFKNLEPRYRKLIAGCGSNVHFKSGQYLLREGEEANLFFAVRQGKVSVEIFVPHQGSVAIETVGEGEILGWSWLFPPYRWKFDARAVESVRATSFDGACLRKKCDADSALGYALMKRFAGLVSQRLDAARLQLLDLYGPAPRG